MKSTNHTLEPLQTGRPAERISLRVEDGVEIYEHDTVTVCRIPKPVSEPILVVDESIQAGEVVFTKRRSEIAGLSMILNSIIGLR